MSYIHEISQQLRSEDKFHHIDMGFLNRRLCIGALPREIRSYFEQNKSHGSDHMTVLSNDHLLVTLLLDVCESIHAPTLLKALEIGKPRHLFRSTEYLAPCPQVYEADRVCHAVEFDINIGKPVVIAYHTSHLVSDTGKMILHKGGYMNSIVGLLHENHDDFEIEPMVIGQPWLDHPRNGDERKRGHLMFLGGEFGEILPEDIDQFSRMSDVRVKDDAEWMSKMKVLPEEMVKKKFASLLSEPTKSDWGGESNDHFSANVSVGGQRKTAAYLLKGPNEFREMTLEMCGKRADQIHRLVDSDADISIVQHAHLIGPVVRRTLRKETILPGNYRRKFCLIDGQATYRILKAYSLL